MWELDHKGGWALKNWCFQIVVLEKILESLLDSKEIKLVNPKGNQSWIFTERIETEAAILWPPDVKNRLTGKDPDAGKDWGQEDKGVTEDETVGWHHWLSRNEFEQAQGDSEGQRSLAWYSPWGRKESDATELLNSNNNTCGVLKEECRENALIRSSPRVSLEHCPRDWDIVSSTSGVT